MRATIYSCTILICVVLAPIILQAQKKTKQPPSTAFEQRWNGFEQRQNLSKESLLNELKFRSVGPTVMSGRVADLDVSPSDPFTFYVAYASGGLWKTTSNGTAFTPLFDKEAAMTIGDIAVDWSNKEKIWVGTGENNSSRSSYSGVGVYKSSDEGKTWQYRGLGESHHIGRVVLHPTDTNTVWVAALGHLYSPNADRGIYKTKDGGATWTKVLFVNENSGAIDLVIDPTNPNTLYASTWHRERRAWNFVESGSGSGIYKSTDGGETWKLLSTAQSGFPTGEGTGRIGLAICPSAPNRLYAILDNQNRRAEEEKKDTSLTKDELQSMTAETFLKIPEARLAEFLKKNEFPDKYDATKVLEMVKNGEINPMALVEYLEDSNSLLFDTPVVGAEVYQSEDAGVTWSKTHAEFLDDIYFSYGYYFGLIRVAPNNPDQIFVAGVPVLRSDDAGKTFKSVNGENVHADHHALWVSPTREGHLVNGNDGGVNISFDNGESWLKANTPAVGQFYAVNVDMAKPYNIYGGLQDNGVWVGPSNYKAATSWHQGGKYPYQIVLGGDGMQIAIDPRDNETVYTGFQFGNYFRINRSRGVHKHIQPRHNLGERPYRFNWQTPIHLSSHNADILYLGSNKLHRSMNQGDDFKEISGDLTRGGIKGDVSYGTLSSVHESILKFGLLYTGSDDGLVHRTKDGGNSWTNITGKLPQNMWVSRVQASCHVESRVYLSLNGYRWDDFSSYLYMSDDYGTTWKRIGENLPAEPVNVIREDPENQDILYVGTDHGLYISLDRGAVFMTAGNVLPAVPVHDLVIHPRDHDLVVGTHGRSIYVADVSGLQKVNKEVLASDLHVFPIAEKKHAKNWGANWSLWLEKDEPEVQVSCFVKEAGELDLILKSSGGVELRRWKFNAAKGLNFPTYDLTYNKDKVESFGAEINAGLDEKKRITLVEAKNKKYYLPPGTYTLVVRTAAGVEKAEVLKVTEVK